jgi:hypothetical protein
MNLWESIFGCRHKSCTFPQTKAGRTTVCCLDCSEELPYDFAGLPMITRKHQWDEQLREEDMSIAKFYELTVLAQREKGVHLPIRRVK